MNHRSARYPRRSRWSSGNVSGVPHIVEGEPERVPSLRALVRYLRDRRRAQSGSTEGTQDEVTLSGLDLPEFEETEASLDERSADQAERVAEAERHRDRRGPGFEPY